MSNKFLGTDITNTNLTNGTATIYAGSLGSASLNPSMPIKTDSLRNLISSKLDIADVNNLQSTLNSVLTNPYNGDLTANKFIKNGGTGSQYLMADGSTLEASGNSGNSNIYLYNNIKNVLTPPPDIGDIIYNNINQENATEIYISHLTRDGLDIERYYNDLTDLNYVYIQDQTTSANFIKYTITGAPTIITESYISIPVIVEDKGGTGATTFGNNHDIMLSFFSNLIEVDARISTLETKTQNQTSIAGTSTTFSGTNGVISNKFIKNGSTSSDILLGDGTTANISRITTLEGKTQNITADALNTTLSNDLTLNNTIIKGTVNIENNKISFGGYNLGTLNNISNNVVLGNNAGTTSNLCQNNILIGQNCGSQLVNGSDNIGIGDGTVLMQNGNKNIHIGTIAGITTKADNNICIGWRAGYAYADITGSDNIFFGATTSSSNPLITNSINIGSNINALNSNEIIIGNSANDNLKMGNSNGFFTGNFRTTGGTSSEFLKANGTTDNNAYLPLSGSTMTGILNMGLNKITSCGIIETNPANNAPIVFGSNNNIAGGNSNIYLGKNNLQTTKSNNNIVGYGNGIYGSNNNVFGTSNGVLTNIENAVIMGIGCTSQANYASCFGNNCNNLIANTTLIGDPNITSIYPNSAICDLGNSTTPFKDIYYSGELIKVANKLDINYINSFYIGIQFQHGSGSLTLMSNSSWTALGSTSSAVPAYAITNNFTRQLCCGFWTFPTPGNGQVCGYTSTNSTGIQVSTGFQWGLYMALGLADTQAELMASQNFWGLNNVATAMPLNQTTQLSTQRNMICFGSNTTDVNLCIYTAGASTTVKQVDLGANFPSNRGSGADPTNFFRLALYWDGVKIYYKAINTTLNITVHGSFTPLSTDMPATSFSLYPQCVRVQGSPQSTTGTRLKVQRFGVFY